ncbi:MAG: glycoside hydrolase family 28 protein [Acidobacteriota bacterium]
MEKFRTISYAAFECPAPVEVTVRTASPVKTFNVSPHSAGLRAGADASGLSFRLDRPRQLVVTVNGGEKLLLFADPPDPAAPKPGDPGVINVLETGVDPTGGRLETARLQAAIDRVAAAKGVLYFPAGVYLTGSLSLKSDLTLYLAEGARLLGSDDPGDYPVDPGFDEANIRWDPELWLKLPGVDVSYRRLLLIDEATNVRVAGRGTIEGNGKALLGGATGREIAAVGSKTKPHIPGPKPVNIHLILIRRSSGVVFEDVTLLDSPMYNAHVLASDHVTFRNVKMVSDQTVVNTDGIDPDSSRDVLIERCFFLCADDCVSVKTSGQSRVRGDAERITVRHCVFLTRTSAVKLGTEIYVGRQRDIVFEDNDVLETGRGINISSEGHYGYERIRFTGFRIERFDWHRLQFPVHIHVEPRHPDGAAGWIHDVLLQDLKAEVEPPARSRIAGFSAEHDVRGVRFVNYTVAGRVRLDAADAGVQIGPYVSDVTFTRTER